MNSPILKAERCVNKDLQCRNENRCCRKSLNYAVLEMLGDVMDKQIKFQSNLYQAQYKYQIWSKETAKEEIGES